MDTLEYLEEERKKLWAEIVKIKEEELKSLQSEINQLNVNIPQDIKEFEANKNSIRALKAKYKDYKEHYDTVIAKVGQIESNYNNIKEIADKAKTIDEKITTTCNELDEKSTKIKTILEQNAGLPTKIDATLNELSKWNTSYTKASKQVDEIKDEYYKVFGYVKTTADGKSENVDGLVDELNEAYKEVKLNIENLEKTTTEKYTTKINQWEQNYLELKTKIEELLPGAMSAGLAHAFKEKIDDEKSERFWASVIFYLAIIAIIVASIVPVWVNFETIKSIKEGGLETVITVVAKLTWAMLPIYAPLIWVVMFTNKKIKLSKKLIEEYAHKKAIAQTFEGLSKQINDVEDNEISQRLATVLLENTLSASADNPAKYVVDFDKSDNPICEVLNNTKILKLLESSNFKDLLNSENVKAIIDIFKENQLKGKKIKDEESEN